MKLVTVLVFSNTTFSAKGAPVAKSAWPLLSTSEFFSLEIAYPNPDPESQLRFRFFGVNICGVSENKRIFMEKVAYNV